ncbi:hypothetical protein [uncultured Algimonas sp.]|uniref:hypothetical protein n=1 Tax=uncultured Algimonas sp. TaxID=1547920 RepID=UPI00262FC7A7|nr:hypothetical protein [uncultured Algimonas sp.]
MSRLIKTMLGTVGLFGTLGLSGTAQATHCRIVDPAPVKPCVRCDGPVTGTSTLPPLSSYFDHQSKCVARHQPPIKHRPDPVPCNVAVHKTVNCYTIVKRPAPVIHRPVVKRPVIVRPPIISPPVIIHRPAPPPTYYRVVRPVVPVPYPVCVSAACAPAPYKRRYRSRYGY